jgi:DnaJ-domain-containing protein 1
MSSVQISIDQGVYVFYSPYNSTLVALIKSLPNTDRRWDANRKAWLIDPKHGHYLVNWCQKYLGESVHLPQINAAISKSEIRLLEVRYVGSTKDRGDGTRSAYGMVDGQWSVIFPETVLRDWFEAGPPTPTQEITLYAVLGISHQASADELKSAFRRLARQWHPDVCHEIDATQQFQQINYAYQTLSDPQMRRKYDAGLAMAASLGKQQIEDQPVTRYGYRSPLRCGYIMANGQEKMGRFTVEKILAWNDIVRGDQTLVTSWPAGANKLVERWV